MLGIVTSRLVWEAFCQKHRFRLVERKKWKHDCFLGPPDPAARMVFEMIIVLDKKLLVFFKKILHLFRKVIQKKIIEQLDRKFRQFVYYFSRFGDYWLNNWSIYF